MTPARALEEIICGYGLVMAARNRRPTGRTTRYFLEQGREIPDFDLPGRVIMHQSGDIREALSRLTAADTWHNADETRALVELWGDGRSDETHRLWERIARRR